MSAYPLITDMPTPTRDGREVPIADMALHRDKRGNVSVSGMKRAANQHSPQKCPGKGCRG